MIADAHTARAAAVPPQEICGDATLIENHQVGGIELRQEGAPLLPALGDVSAVVFDGPDRSFNGKIAAIDRAPILAKEATTHP